MQRTLRQKTYEALETDEGQDEYLALRASLAVLLVLNLVSVALNTVPSVVEQHAIGLLAFEIVAVALMSIEFGFRLWACVEDPRYASPLWGRLRYLTRPMSIIDMVAIVPSYFSLTGYDLRFLRTLRLLRLLRVLKFGRYSEGVGRIDEVIQRKRGELVSALVLVLILLTLASGLMYFAEHDAQPEVFSTLPETFWWSTMMMAGEFGTPPVTVLGRLLGVVIALLGIGLFALPAGIIASGLLSSPEPASAEDEIERASDPPPAQPRA